MSLYESTIFPHMIPLKETKCQRTPLTSCLRLRGLVHSMDLTESLIDHHVAVRNRETAERSWKGSCFVTLGFIAQKSSSCPPPPSQPWKRLVCADGFERHHQAMWRKGWACTEFAWGRGYAVQCWLEDRWRKAYATHVLSLVTWVILAGWGREQRLRAAIRWSIGKATRGSL